MPERALDANYIEDWPGETGQCQHCVSWRSKNGKNICLASSDKSFEETLADGGETSPQGHCDYFQSID